jgi:hypothetical protein
MVEQEIHHQQVLLKEILVETDMQVHRVDQVVAVVVLQQVDHHLVVQQEVMVEQVLQLQFQDHQQLMLEVEADKVRRWTMVQEELAEVVQVDQEVLVDMEQQILVVVEEVLVVLEVQEL